MIIFLKIYFSFICIIPTEQNKVKIMIGDQTESSIGILSVATKAIEKFLN